MQNIVFIAIPHGKQIEADGEIDRLRLIRYSEKVGSIGIRIGFRGNATISSNRNALVQMVRQEGATHILFIDDDMIFPDNALIRLLSHDKDIACATYCRRGDESGIPVGLPVENSVENNGLREMEIVGSGFMLVKMSVYEVIPRPYYYEQPNSDGGIFGEDMTFCLSARKAGFNIYADMNLSKEIGHIGKKAFFINPEKISGNEFFLHVQKIA